ncbi:hypothetical protein DOK_11791 [gamma proteobacterium BDW918]|nr:hypothetical protein DOK_11791 [gamma proteobacterium BDW918]
MRRILLSLILSLSIQQSLAVEIIHYKNVPVVITLTEGEERSIEFGDHVQVGVTKGQQQGDLFRVQSAQGFVHIRANKTFSAQRVQIKRLTDDRVILVDFVSEPRSAQSVANLEPVKIILDSENVAGGNTVDEAEAVVLDGAKGDPVVTPVELVRYVSQRLYGPSRLHKDVVGITETPLDIKKPVKIFKGEALYKTVSQPFVAYRGGAYHIAGIYIKNTSDSKLKLNYLELNIPFTTATFQHHVLQPNGIPGDATMLYLVSEEPLKNVLQPWTYYQELQQAEAAMLAEKK